MRSRLAVLMTLAVTLLALALPAAAHHRLDHAAMCLVNPSHAGCESATPSHEPSPSESPSPSDDPSPSPTPEDSPVLTTEPAPECDVTFSGSSTDPDGLTVPAGQVWCFDPSRDTTVETPANVIVHGVLQMRPATADIDHTLRFTDINESAFVGGGSDVLASDVGLWVMDAGQLDLQGTPRAGWNRTGTDPTWQAGDEVRVAPNAVGDYTSFPTFTPGDPVPSVTNQGVSYPSEVFNLTRNVRVEGTPTGRTHVFVRSTQPQTIRYAAIRHVGPKAGQVGRYGLHFHHAGDGSRGTLVEGVVVRDAGNHAFVPHGSHGITLRDTIAFNTQDAAYWWDPEPSRFDYPTNASFDVTYEHAAAFLVQPRATDRASLTGFYLGQGEGNACVECVAVGVQGGQPSNGMHWPSKANLQPNVWTFRDGVTHNNKRNGVYVWQNDGDQGGGHVIDGLVSYRNGRYGIEHGAYTNSYQYGPVAVFGNGWGAIAQHANGRSPNGIGYTGSLDASGNGSVLRILAPKLGNTDYPSVWFDMTWANSSGDPIVVDNNHDTKDAPETYDFVRVAYEGRDLEPFDFTFVSVEPGSVFRVQRLDGTAYQIDSDGKVTTIASFHP